MLKVYLIALDAVQDNIKIKKGKTHAKNATLILSVLMRVLKCVHHVLKVQVQMIRKAVHVVHPVRSVDRALVLMERALIVTKVSSGRVK